MAQDVLVRATCLFQFVGKGRHLAERSVIVYRLGELDHGRRQPGRIGKSRAQGHRAKDVTKQGCLSKTFGILGTDLGMIGDSGLGAECSVSGSDCGVRGGSVPSGLASCSLTRQPSGTQLLRAGKPIGIILRYRYRSTTEDINPIPDAPRTSDG
jgi:hypothetical protein